MSILDFFTGKGGQKAAAAANQAFQSGITDAKGTISAGYGQAGQDIAQNFYDARGALNGGANEAASHLSRGYGDAKTAYGGYFDQGTDAVGTGYQSAIDSNRGAMGGVKDDYQTYSTAGKGAQDLYSAFLGLKGAPAQRAAMSSYSDPYGQAIEDRTVAALNRQANAGGFIGSGRSSLAASRAVGEGAYGRQMDYMRMLQEQAGRGQAGELQIGQMGLQNAGNIGQLYASQGATLGNMYGTAAKDAAGFDIAHGTGQANNMKDWGQQTAANYMTEGQLASNLALGEANSIANLGMAGANKIGETELAKQAAKQQGFNNILNLAGTVAKFIPGMPSFGSVGK